MRQTKTIQKITGKNDIAKRGLTDLSNFYMLEQLQEQMLLHFKAGEFAACIRVCNKIKKVKPDDLLVVLILHSARSRMSDKKK